MALPDFRQLIDEATGRRPAPAPESDADARILDGALAAIAEYGEQRLTMDDVAAEARVGRATVFRRFGSKEALLGRLYAREIRRALALAFAAAPEDGDAADVLTAVAGALADHVAGHPVIVRIARVEPGLMVELWRTGDPSGFDVLVAFLRAVVAERAPGSDAEAVRAAAELVCRLIFAEVLLPAGSAKAQAARRRRIRGLAADGLARASR